MSYATCQACGREMKVGGGCTCTHEFDGTPRRRNEGGVCHDCNAGLEKYHHPGCDWERCAWCGVGQAIGCDCEASKKAFAAATKEVE